MDARSMEGPPLHLSSIVELYPGDLIFTGTPGGVGFGRSPQQYLVPGDELISSIEGLGEIRQTSSVEVRPARTPHTEKKREASRQSHSRGGRPKESSCPRSSSLCAS